MTRTPIIAQHDAIRCPAVDTLAADIIAMLRELGLRVITAVEARREIPPPPPPYPPGDGR